MENSPAARALPFLLCSPIPHQLPGAEPNVPTFPSPWAAGTGTARPGMPQTPTCPSPCRLLHCARVRSSKHGGDGSRALPGLRGGESSREHRPRSGHPVLQEWVPSTLAEGVPALKLCQSSRFHGHCQTRSRREPLGKAGAAAPRLGDGSGARGGLCEPVPRPGECASWERQAAAQRACLQQALTCTQLVLAFSVHPRVPRCRW